MFISTEDKENADLWLLNSCTVKTPSEDGFKNFVKEAKSKDKYIVVAGCVPQADRSNKEIQGISVVGVSSQVMSRALMYCFYLYSKACIIRPSTIRNSAEPTFFPYPNGCRIMQVLLYIYLFSWLVNLI